MLHATVQRSCLLLAATAARHHVQVGSWPSLSQERIKGSQYFRLDARIFLMRLSFKSYPCLAVRTFHAVEGLITALGRLMNSESTPCQSVWKLCREGASTWGRENLELLLCPSVARTRLKDFTLKLWKNLHRFCNVYKGSRIFTLQADGLSQIQGVPQIE